MLEAGFPKKETCVVVGKKYDLSYPTVLKILKEAEVGKASDIAGKASDIAGKASDIAGKASDIAGKACGKASLDTSNTVGKACGKACGKASLDTSPITSADIVDGIIKKFGKKGDDYVDAFNRAPKDADGAIVMKNGSKVYF